MSEESLKYTRMFLHDEDGEIAIDLLLKADESILRAMRSCQGFCEDDFCSIRKDIEKLCEEIQYLITNGVEDVRHD